MYEHCKDNNDGMVRIGDIDNNDINDNDEDNVNDDSNNYLNKKQKLL